MDKIYQTPSADVVLFRPVEALAWEDLLAGQQSQPSQGANSLSGDITIKL